VLQDPHFGETRIATVPHPSSKTKMSSTSTTAVSSESSQSSTSSDTARRTAEARLAVTASLSSVGSAYDTDLQKRAADLHANSAVIEKQEKELIKQTAALRKETAKWEKLVDGSTKELNKIGDVQNWAEVMERELLVIEETLRLADGGVRANEASGTPGWI